MQCLLLLVFLQWHPGTCVNVPLLALVFGVLLSGKTNVTAPCRRNLRAYHGSHGRSDTSKEGPKPGSTLLRELP